jgi:hypothetical protein
VCIRYRGNVSTKPLPGKDKGIFTEPLRSNDKGRYTYTHRQQRDLISLFYFFKISKVGENEMLSLLFDPENDQWASTGTTISLSLLSLLP